MTKKKILKFVNNKKGKMNILSQVINVTTDKKKTKLIPLLTLDYFRRKKDGK
tara:strand:+ start:1636 stop:1791 length:156 start_codon:yes stop_codon:yes gene_type:complete